MKPSITKRIFLILGLMAGIGFLSACSSSDSGSTSAENGVVQSSLERKLTPAVADADLSQLVSDNNAFAFDLYQKLRTENGNLFYSPFSISVALAMTYAGARGDTAAEMAQTMRYTLSQEQLHPAFNKLDLEINSRGKDVAAKEGTGFSLCVANAIWGQQGKTWLQSFLDTLAANYGAGLRVLDFASEPEKARTTINDWVAEQTQQKIKDLLPPNSVTGVSMVLTNAIYFKASWLYPFEKSATGDGVFTLLDGSTVTVPMMKQNTFFPYTDGEGYIALSLPYVGNALSMIILMPDKGNFEYFERLLTADKLSEIKSALTNTDIMLSLPRFEFEDPTPLKDVLKSMGMKLAFSAEADFSGMDGARSLFISGVIHKAFVKVNEEGTEAAAATAVTMVTGIQDPPIAVKIDRPFIFLIQDKSGAILFIGRVVNPKT